MDPTNNVLTSIWTALTTDTQLNDLISDRVYHKSPRDSAWPYVTMRLDTLQGLDSATRPALLTLHAWDRSTNTARAHELRAHIVRILDLQRFTTPDGIMRCWHSSTAWLTDEDDQVVHVVMQFDVRYARALEVLRSMTQEGN